MFEGRYLPLLYETYRSWNNANLENVERRRRSENTTVVVNIGQGPDQSGRYIFDVWNFTFYQLEAVHDYIQWLFPTSLHSGVNVRVKGTTKEERKEFVHGPYREQYRSNLSKSLNVMLHFYGLMKKQYKKDTIIITRDPSSFKERAKIWLVRNRDGTDNHNNARISRILRCLSELGLRNEGKALLLCLRNEIYSDSKYRSIIGKYSWEKWTVESNWSLEKIFCVLVRNRWNRSFGNTVKDGLLIIGNLTLQR